MLPKGSTDYVLYSREFRVEIVAAEITKYGCRIQNTIPAIEKDQSQLPQNKR